MAEQALKNMGAGYSIAASTYQNKLSVKSPSASLHIVTFQTAYQDTQILFYFDESYPSRVPRFVVNSPTVSRDQKYDLVALLQRKGKTEEYSNTPLLPLLLDHAIKWLKENYGKGSVSSKKSERSGEIREESWQLSPRSEPESVYGTGGAQYKESYLKDGKNNSEKKKQRKKTVDNSGIMPVTLEAPAADVLEVGDDSQGDTIFNGDDYDRLPEGSGDWAVVPARSKPKSQNKDQILKFTLDTVPHVPVKEDTRRANYFVAIRCTNSDIGNAVEETVKKILEVDSVYEPICYNRNEVHVTLTIVALHTDKEVEAAVKALEDAKDVLVNHAPTSLLTVNGIDDFQGSKVVFGKVKIMEDVLLFRKVIQWVFKNAGIAPRDNYEYHPHMTLVKTNMTFTRSTGLKTIARSAYESLSSTYFGKQAVKAIHLCKMGRERRDDGFYVCPTSIDLKK